MNRVLHLARKDARRLGPAFSFWLCLIPVAPGLLVWKSAHAAPWLSAHVSDVLGVLHGILLLAGFLLAAQLSLEDPLHTPDAAWRTRPVSRRDLLLSKISLALVALVLAPVALLVVVWLAAGFNARDIAALALDQAAAHSLFAGLGLLLGATSRNLGQALLWLCGGLPLLLILPLAFHAGTGRLAGPLLLLAAITVPLGLLVAFMCKRGRFPALILFFAGLTFFSAVGLAPSPPPLAATTRVLTEQPFAVGSEIRADSVRCRLVHIEPFHPNSSPADPTPLIRVSWCKISPAGALLPSRPRPTSSTIGLHVQDATPAGPRELRSDTSSAGGVHLVRTVMVLSADQRESATWFPSTGP